MDDFTETQIRNSWTKNSKVHIFSTSQKRWFIGRIHRIFNDAHGEWLEIHYNTGVKYVQRFSSIIHPLPQPTRAEEETIEEELSIRDQWKKFDCVQIYSNSNERWYDGVIQSITYDKEGEWLFVVCPAGNIMKPVQRYSNDIRPVYKQEVQEESSFIDEEEQRLREQMNELARRREQRASMAEQCRRALQEICQDDQPIRARADSSKRRENKSLGRSLESTGMDYSGNRSPKKRRLFDDCAGEFNDEEKRSTPNRFDENKEDDERSESTELCPSEDNSMERVSTLSTSGVSFPHDDCEAPPKRQSLRRASRMDCLQVGD